MTPNRTYGLIGFPVRHSLSPLIHNAAFSHLKLKARYKLFEVSPKELGDFLKSLSNNNISGLNVTIPYKEAALKYLDTKDNAVKVIGAANTILVDRKKRLKGFNTDYLGFSRHLTELKVKPKRVAIIGAGGASRAVAFALAKKRAQEITVFDIDTFRSISLVKRFYDLFPKTKFKAVAKIEELDMPNQDLLINASGVGMKDADPCLIKEGMLHKDLFVYDLIYNPVQTKLLRLAEENGCFWANGLGMLLYQGVLSFEHFTGKSAPIKIMKEALEKGAKKL